MQKEKSVFYPEVVRSGVVWTIRDDDGIPAPKNNDGKRAMPFWSDRRLAEEIIQSNPAYSKFSLYQIKTEDFISQWLDGLEKDEILVGINWSGIDATGHDVLPHEVKSNFEEIRKRICNWKDL